MKYLLASLIAAGLMGGVSLAKKNFLCSDNSEHRMYFLNFSSYDLNLGVLSGSANIEASENTSDPYEANFDCYQTDDGCIKLTNNNLKGKTLNISVDLDQAATSEWSADKGFSLTDVEWINDTSVKPGSCGLSFKTQTGQDSLVCFHYSHGAIYIYDNDSEYCLNTGN